MDSQLLLQQFHLKVTPQRLEIVNLLQIKGHISIEDLFVFLQNKFPSISLATIYKNINKMCQKGFLSEVKIPDTKNVYELTKEDHAHIVCTQCGTILDIDIDISTTLSDVKNTTKFNIVSSSVVFEGICPNCMKI